MFSNSIEKFNQLQVSHTCSRRIVRFASRTSAGSLCCVIRVVPEDRIDEWNALVGYIYIYDGHKGWGLILGVWGVPEGCRRWT